MVEIKQVYQELKVIWLNWCVVCLIIELLIILIEMKLVYWGVERKSRYHYAPIERKSR